jgi:hypothetical protein
MTITLDDLFCLFHLPIRGDFYTPPSCINDEGVAALARKLLGVFNDTTMEDYEADGWIL